MKPESAGWQILADNGKACSGLPPSKPSRTAVGFSMSRRTVHLALAGVGPVLAPSDNVPSESLTRPGRSTR